MLLKNIIWILFVCLVKDSSGKEQNWLETFIRYLKVDARVHQVVLMLEDKNNYHRVIEKTTEQITNNFPSRKISYSEATINKAKDLLSTLTFFNPKTSLFVVVLTELDDRKFPELIKIFEFVNELSEHRSRPKCFIIIFENKKRRYKTFLRFLWSKQFLDVTILELLKSEIEDNHYFLEHDEKNATFYFLNPFIDKIIKIKDQNRYYHATQNMSWFPNKLLNLYGYQIKVAYLHAPPEVFLIRNRSEHIVDSFGPMVLKLENLAKHMNFSLWIHPNITTRGKFTCNKNDSTGMYHSLKNNEIQLTSLEFGRFSSCDQHLYEWGKGIGKHHMLLVVPLLPTRSSQLSTTWKTSHGVIVFILPSFIWIFSRIFHFNPLNWRLTNIIQMMFGFSIPREPRNQVERIVFIFILWAFFLYSSLIYTVFTRINVPNELRFRFKSIEDVIDSELEPMIGVDFYQLMYPGSNGIVQRLLHKATKENVSSRTCILQLIEHKNVACVVREDHIQMILRDTKDSCGHPVVKVMKNHFHNTLSATVLDPGSPYVKPIDDFVQRMEESGITGKWWMTYFFNQSTPALANSPSCVKNKLEFVEIIRLGIPFLILGHGCAFVVFIGEVIFDFIIKSIHR